MAGAAKPNVVGLGEEGRHIIVSENLVYPNSAPGLFSGACEGGWQSGTAMWQLENHSLEIELLDICRIWRSGYFAPYYYGMLRLHKKNADGTYTEITGQPTVTNIGNKGWEVFTTVLYPGIYRFSSPYNDPTRYGRIDSEWYIEKVSVDSILILDGVQPIATSKQEVEVSLLDMGNMLPTYEKEGELILFNDRKYSIQLATIYCESVNDKASLLFKELGSQEYKDRLTIPNVKPYAKVPFNFKVVFDNNDSDTVFDILVESQVGGS